MPEVVAVVEETPKVEEPDEFSAAFEQLSVANDAARAASDASPTGVAPPPAAPEPVAVVEEPPVAVEEPKPPVKVLEPPAPVPQAPPRMSDEEIARIAAIASQVQRPPPAPAQAQAQEPAIFSPEEIEFLGNYQQEYSDIARGEALLRRKDILDAVRFVFSEVTKVVEPTRQIAQQLYERTHLGDLQRLVPENRLTREEAVAWAQQQPDFLRPSYFNVIQQGTPEQVAQFTAMVRASQSASIPAVNGTSHAAAVAAPPARQDPVQQRALAALRPVPSKRSGIGADAVEPGDFDSAFERFAAQVDQRAR